MIIYANPGYKELFPAAGVLAGETDPAKTRTGVSVKLRDRYQSYFIATVEDSVDEFYVKCDVHADWNYYQRRANLVSIILGSEPYDITTRYGDNGRSQIGIVRNDVKECISSFELMHNTRHEIMIRMQRAMKKLTVYADGNEICAYTRGSRFAGDAVLSIGGSHVDDNAICVSNIIVSTENLIGRICRVLPTTITTNEWGAGEAGAYTTAAANKKIVQKINTAALSNYQIESLAIGGIELYNDGGGEKVVFSVDGQGRHEKALRAGAGSGILSNFMNSDSDGAPWNSSTIGAKQFEITSVGE